MKHILYAAPYSETHTGYGIAAAGIKKILLALQTAGAIERVTLCDTTRPMIPLTETADIAIVMVNPVSIVSVHHKTMQLINNIRQHSTICLLSIVWETSPLPASWHDLLHGELFDGFIGPSEFVVEQIKNATIKPVYHIPYHIDLSDIPVLDHTIKQNEQFFTALYIGQHTTRKGIEDTVISYTRALADKPDTKLVIKYHRLSNKEIDIETTIRHLALCNGNGIRNGIYTIDDNIGKSKIYALLASSSVLLFPSRGEGFGLPAIEAMAIGIPVIYTDWSALHETCDIDGNYPVAYTLDEAYNMAQYGYSKGTQYAVPLMHDLMKAEETAYTDWKTDRNAYYQRMQGARAHIESKYGHIAVADAVVRMINAI